MPVSVQVIDDSFKTLEVMVRRNKIVRTLFPDGEYPQGELAKKTGIASSNMSRYISELEETGIIDIVSNVNDRGQPIKLIKLSKMSLDVLRDTAKIVSSGKPLLKDLESLKVFLDGLLIPDLQEYSKNSVQIISNQYKIPIDSGYFEFLEEHFLDTGLEKARRVLIMSTRNAVMDMDTSEKKKVRQMLEPLLIELLQNASEGIEKETRDLFQELGVYNLSYEKLEELYLAEILKAKTPGFYRTLILKNHHDKVPRFRAKIMGLHQESDNSIRSIIRDELPLIR